MAEMLTKLFLRKAERDGTADRPDLLACFLHEVRLNLYDLVPCCGLQLRRSPHPGRSLTPTPGSFNP